MASERKMKLTLDGEREFKNALNSINLQTKRLNAEMKAVTSSFDKNTTAEEKNRKTTEILERRQTSYREKIEKLNDRIAERTDKFGENSDIVNKLKTDLFNTETAMNKMTSSVQNMGERSDDRNDKSSRFMDVLKRNVLGDFITKGLETIRSKFIEIGKRMVELGFTTAALADDLNTLSRQTGLSTETLQRFRYRSKFVDVEESTLTGSLTKLTRNMYSRATGSRSAAEGFSRLGINIKNVDGSLRPAYDVFLDAIDALGKIDDETTRDGLRMQIFGKSRQQLNPLIKAGSGALNEYREQRRAVGYILDDETLSALNAVNDEVDRAKLQFERIKNQLGVEMRPVIHEIVSAMGEFVSAVDWETVGQIIYVAMMTVTGAFMAAYTIIKTVIDTVVWLGGVFEEIPVHVQTAAEGIAAKIDEIKTNIKTKFDEMVESAKTWGRDLINGFIEGIKQKISDLKTMMSNVASTIAGYIHFSRPDVGALRNYEQWMPDMIDGLVRTLNSSRYKLENAVSGMAGNMASGMGGVVISGITINGVRDETQIDRMVNQIEKKLGRRLY